ncbi:MAG: hypothetical protein H6585_12905 [Flavobacteriales bacterium]|nr:hypothetical protein [Flavobacteriales bacterium]MCB9449231.1 hypothetical protein [Flavobacteriales bacterium]
MKEGPWGIGRETLWDSRSNRSQISFQPVRSNLSELEKAGDTLSENGVRAQLPWKPGSLFSWNQGNFRVRLDPVFQLDAPLPAEHGPEWVAGFRLRTGSAHWGIEWEGVKGEAALPGYLEDFRRLFQVYPGLGYADSLDRKWIGFGTTNLRFSWQPSDIFRLEAGKGKHFIGDGYRSLLLSYNASPYPFVRLETHVWHLTYTNLFARLEDIQGSNGDRDLFRGKFTAIHYLDWRLCSGVDVGVFEAIVWQNDDMYGPRGFDINYLNPVIFYRPVEFSLGSPDNALMGLNLRVYTGKKSYLYGQLCLDEFYLVKVRAWNGWSSNKQGVQAGWKQADVFGKENMSIRLEGNYVRPYTYTHVTPQQNITDHPLQNYAHFNEALAHPLRANFVEGLTRVRYDKKQWSFAGGVSFALYGDDSTGTNFGRNIFLPYPDTYGNHVGQGIRTTLFAVESTCRRVLNPVSGLNIFGRFYFRSVRQPAQSEQMFFVQVGLSSWWPSRYLDF